MPRFITGLRDVKRARGGLFVLLTVEVRWFHTGKIPARLRSWFRKLPAKAKLQPSRVDHYLLDDDTDALGIKFRDGRLEVKQRQDQPWPVSFRPGWEGNVESWLKWSFPLENPRQRDKEFQSLENWIAVEKKRRVITYSISPKGKLIALSGDVGVELGCSVELAQLRVKGVSWWSLGFEAKGNPEDLASTLEQVAQAVLDGFAAPKFDPIACLSYPGWLRALNEHADALK